MHSTKLKKEIVSMPEGPELKTSRDLINPIIKNKVIINCYPSKNGRYKDKSPKGFQPTNWSFSKIEEISVKGKFMYWRLGNDQYLCSTYGMTGQWSEKENKHTCFTVQYLSSIDDLNTNEDFTYKSKFIYFNDPRHFGTISFLNRKELEDKLSSLGWDPFQEDLNNAFDKIKKQTNKKKNIGELLLDQKIFSGCGNYIRAEALYRARINPWKLGKDLTEYELKDLCLHIKNVMIESYQYQGASFKTYYNADGSKGNYSFNFKVYAQEKDPNGFKIERSVMGARTIHWCPEIQKF